MMPLRRRVCFFPVTSCSRSKFIVNGHLTLNNLKIPARDVPLKKYSADNAKIITPESVKPDTDNLNIGAELVGELTEAGILSVLDPFLSKDDLYVALLDKGIDGSMCETVKSSFKRFCLNKNQLPPDLYIILCDLAKGHGHVLDLLPYFLQHSLLVYPHLKYKEELSRTGDLTSPEIWFHSARSIKRKFIFHYGPTNSGKTYKALERFLVAKRGIYCSPLKLLAHEIFEKSNKGGVPCDLVTGEEKRRVSSDGSEADHVSCTVEMASVNIPYDVAVIDEIQMIRDVNRGFAWTRALLGIVANEIHLCGEESALEYIVSVAERLGEKIETIKYKRLTKLFLEHKAVESFKNIKDGDCIICFSKKDIIHVMKALDNLNIEYAVIYGMLPPGTKAHQCNKFNDPGNKCNVLVATDAVGLGLNLNIRRIVFYSVEKVSEVIPVSLALQIAGRAGRYKSRYDEGYVAAFRQKDVKILKELLSATPETVKKAGLLPTAEQIETFSYYLPNSGFTELIDIFNSLCVMNDLYFMCDLTNFKKLARLIQHTNLSIKNIYTFCCSPVNYGSLMNQTLFVKFAKKYSSNEVITITFMKKFLNWPFKNPLNLSDLEVLEEAYDALDLYLWFGNRFPVLFPDGHLVRGMQEELDNIIRDSVVDLARVIKRTGKVEEISEPTEKKLLEKGILTPFLMAKLKTEWLNEMKKKNEAEN